MQRGKTRRFCLLIISSAILHFPVGRNLCAEGNESAGSVSQSNASGANSGSLTPPGSADNFLFTGSFLYSLSFEVPPGVGGMQPELTLQYNSSSGNGFAGHGWDFSLGVIQRSTRNGIPTYDDTRDVFVFASKGQMQELVRIAPNEYRTKIEGAFQRFVKTATNQWVVTDKSGTNFYFGQQPASRVDGSVATFLWALDRVVDRNSNVMDVFYYKEGSQIYLDHIDYGANLSTGRGHDRKVTFERFQNLTPSFSYAAGFRVDNKYLLKNVRTYFNGSDVSRYELMYADVASSDGSRFLKMVKRFGLNGLAEFPRQKFTYVAENASPSSFNGGFPLTASDWKEHSDQIVPGDFNGDGKSDYLYFRDQVPGMTTPNRGSRLFFSNGDGTFRDTGKNLDYDFSAPSNRIVPVDVTGDAKTDLIAYNDWPGTFNQFPASVFVSNGDGTFTKFPFPGDLSSWRNVVVPGDFNADGKMDILIYRPSDTGQGRSNVFLSNGNGTFTDKGPLPGADFNQLDTFVVPGDLNGDRKTDLIWYRNWRPGNGSAIYFSNGDGTFRKATSVPACNFSNQNNALIPVDCNHDNLTDIIVWRGATPVKPSENPTSILISKGDGTFEITSSLTNIDYRNQSAFYRIADIDGDSYADVIVGGFNPTAFSATYLTGLTNGNFSWKGGVPGGLASDVIPADANGDGRSDLFVLRTGKDVTSYTPSADLFLSNNDALNPISTIQNGIGGETRVEFSPSSRFSNRFLPFVTNPVTRITVLTGVCDPAKNECPSTTYSYEGGHFDVPTQEFLGFSKVTATDAAGNKTITFFHQDKNLSNAEVPVHALKGLVYKTETYDNANRLLISQDATWSYPSPYTGVYFPRKDSIQSKDWTSSPPLITQIDFAYDGFGNVNRTMYKGDTSVTGDERTEIVEYAADAGRWLMSFPSRNRIEDGAGVLLSDTYFLYDGFTSYGSISRGNVTEVQRFVNKPSFRWIKTKSEYNGFGQLTAMIDGNGNRTETTYDANGFPSTIKNALGQIVSSVYDPKTGNELSSTDANGQLFQHRYDNLGRCVKDIGPMDTDSLPSITYIYYPEIYPTIFSDSEMRQVEKQVRVLPGQSAVVRSKISFDGLGRAWQTEKFEESKSIVTKTVYDNRGLVQKVSVPRYSTATGEPLWTTTAYDALGRVVKIQKPQKPGQNNYVSTTYSGRTTDVTNVVNGTTINKQTSAQDAYGRVITRWEPSVPNPTIYNYDGLGNLIKVRDSANPPNETTFTYDSLSRKLSMVDPNAGTWSYTYDDNGNLISQTDGRRKADGTGVTLTFQYDRLNRLVIKKLTSDSLGVTGQVVGSTLAVYGFDQVDASRPYSIGRLTSVQDLSGATQFYHDQVGRLVRQVKTVDGLNYDVKNSFNSLNLITQAIYPNSQTVNYGYDSLGRLTQIANANGTVYASYAYDLLDRVINFDQAGGKTRTSYAFDPNDLSLAGLKLDSYATASTQTLKNLSYAFDGVGNLQSINDNVQPTRNQTFTYDSLNRLVRGVGEYGDEAFVYDSLGNFQSKGGVTYAYGDPKHPYAPTQTYPADIPAKDTSTLLAWNLDPSEPIYSLSGTVQTSGLPSGGVPVVLSGLYQTGVFTNISGAVGSYTFRNVAGDIYSVGVASAGTVSNPPGYAFNPLAQTNTSLTFSLSRDLNPLDASKLRIPRTAIGHGSPLPFLSSGTVTAGLIGGLGYGGQSEVSGALAHLSGYSPLSDSNDTQLQSPNPSIPPPSATVFGVVGPSFVPGRYQQSLSFNGSTDLFVFPNSSSLKSNTMTLMLWVKPQAYPSSNYATLLAKSTGSALGKITSGYRLVLNPSGKVVLEVVSGTGLTSVTSGINLPVNKWTFISATLDGAFARIYFDTQKVAETPFAGAPNVNDASIVIAGSVDEYRRTLANTFFKGVIDDPRVQGRVWTPVEIAKAIEKFNASAAYAYDGNGNRSSKNVQGSTWAYRYDSENRLTNVTFDGAVAATYVYDGDGGRLKKIAANGTTLYIGKLFEKRPDGSLVDHVYGQGQLICDIVSTGAATQTSFYHADHLGSISIVTNSSGAKLEELSYRPFGEIYSDVGSSAVHNKYTGQEDDPETGLYFYNARYYDPVLGRFLTPDSVVQDRFNPQCLNRYAYVQNNPLNYIDPNGHYTLRNFLKSALPVITIGAAVLLGPGATFAEYMVLAAASSAAGAALERGSTLGSIMRAATVGGIVGGVSGIIGSASGDAVGAYASGILGEGTGSFVGSTAMGAVGGFAAGAGIKALYGGDPRDVWRAGYQGAAWGAGIIGVGKIMQYAYKRIVGYDTNGRPGVGVVSKQRYDYPVEGVNNIGTANLDPQNGGLWAEGGPVSRFMNQIPGVNAVGGMHDVFQIQLDYFGDSYAVQFNGMNMVKDVGGLTRNLFNVLGMPVAAGITYPALLAGPQFFPLQAQILISN